MSRELKPLREVLARAAARLRALDAEENGPVSAG